MATKAAPRGRGAIGKWEHIRDTFYTFLESSICGISICFPKSKFRSGLFRSHSKVWYVDPRNNSDLRSRSFDLFPPPHRPVYTGYARYENSDLVSRNYSIRTYCTSSTSNLVNRTYCPKPSAPGGFSSRGEHH